MEVWNSKYIEDNLSKNDKMRLLQQISSHIQDLQPIPTLSKAKLYPLENIKVVLFDIYGTLLISSIGEISSDIGEQEKGLNATDLELRENCLSVLPPTMATAFGDDFNPKDKLKQAIRNEHQKRLTENPEGVYPEVDIVSIWHSIFLNKLDGTLASTLTPFMLARYIIEFEMRVNRVQLMPGVQELLYWLTSRSIILGIISNAQFYTPLILLALLKQENLSDMYFDPELMFWSYSHSYSKPNPAMFDSAIEVLKNRDIKAEETLYIGNDMHNDIWGAMQHGMHSALFAGDQRSLRLREDDPLVSQTQPTMILQELTQIKGVLN